MAFCASIRASNASGPGTNWSAPGPVSEVTNAIVMGAFPPLDPPVEVVVDEVVVDEEVVELDEQPARIKTAPMVTALSTRIRRCRRNPGG